MVKKEISSGTVHSINEDLREALMSNPLALKTWESLTPLARNEWICWITYVKKLETRKEHVERTIEELTKGKKRPCCWMGCIHRTDKPISPSVRGILNRKR